MSYSALVTQILLSSPSDLAPEHRQIILDGVRAWNSDHGRIYGVHFSLVDWKHNAAAGVGDYAQAVLNTQIVQESDAGLVIFTDRMGTPTRDFPSGTAEEIDLLLELRRDVAVLHNKCPRPQVQGEEAVRQKELLDEYVTRLYDRALVKSYQSPEELRREVDLVLTFLARKVRREADAGLTDDLSRSDTADNLDPDATRHQEDSAQVTAGVWPRVEVSESFDVRRGRTSRKWRLVLQSTLAAPTYDVTLHFEDADGAEIKEFDLGRTAHQTVEVLPPKGSVSLPLLQAWGSPSQALCVVTWKDAEGAAHETRATVRTG